MLSANNRPWLTCAPVVLAALVYVGAVGYAAKFGLASRIFVSSWWPHPGFKQAVAPEASPTADDSSIWHPPTTAQGFAACSALAKANALPSAKHPTFLQSFAKTSPSLAVVTFVDNEQTCGYKRLVASAATHGLSVVNGFPRGATWNANLKGGARLAASQAWLLAQPPHALVLMVDGFDVVLTANASAILAGYRSALMDTWHQQQGRESLGGVVYGGEANVHFAYRAFSPQPHRSIAGRVTRRYPPAPTLLRYLQAGTVMGPAAELAALVSAAIEDFAPGNEYGNAKWLGNSDQTLLSAFLVLHSTLNRKHADASTATDTSRASSSTGLLWEGLLPHGELPQHQSRSSSGAGGLSQSSGSGILVEHEASGLKCSEPPMMSAASGNANIDGTTLASPCTYVAAHLNQFKNQRARAKPSTLPSSPGTTKAAQWAEVGRLWLRRCCLPRIDSCQRIFIAAEPVDGDRPLQFAVKRNGRGIQSLLTGSQPPVLHAPGKACSSIGSASRAGCELVLQTVRREFTPNLLDCPGEARSTNRTSAMRHRKRYRNGNQIPRDSTDSQS